MEKLTYIRKEKIKNAFNDRLFGLGEMIERGIYNGFMEDGNDFIKFKKYIKDFNMLINVINDDNENGGSDRWNEVKFIWE
jgi:hypothetical protein